jgi:hypothetical protein
MADSVAAQETSGVQRISDRPAELDSFLLRSFTTKIKRSSAV